MEGKIILCLVFIAGWWLRGVLSYPLDAWEPSKAPSQARKRYGAIGGYQPNRGSVSPCRVSIDPGKPPKGGSGVNSRSTRLDLRYLFPGGTGE